MKLVLLLFIASVSFTSITAKCGFTHVVDGIYSKTTCNPGLSLPNARRDYIPISALITTVLVSKSSSVFVHYQITVSVRSSLQTRLQINGIDVGSIVRTSGDLYQTISGFWMGKLSPGYYTFRVLYKGTTFKVPSSVDWQTTKLQVTWFEQSNSFVLTDNIKCYYNPTSSSNERKLVDDTRIVLNLLNSRTVLGAYQFSTESSRRLFTLLDVNNVSQPSASFAASTSRYPYYLDVHGVWADKYERGTHYFNLYYQSLNGFKFTDCQLVNSESENFYVMMLPSTCNVVKVNPRTYFELNSTSSWLQTDVCYSLRLRKTCHAIIMYHFASESSKSHNVFNRLTRNSVPMEHTTSISGDALNAGNTGVWMGALDQGDNNICLEYTSSGQEIAAINNASHLTRSLSIVYCCS